MNDLQQPPLIVEGPTTFNLYRVQSASGRWSEWHIAQFWSGNNVLHKEVRRIIQARSPKKRVNFYQ